MTTTDTAASDAANAATATGATATGATATAAPESTGTPASGTPLPPELAEFERLATSNAEVPLSMLFSLSLPISIELGRTNMTVQEILRLGRGSVIQLDRLAGQPIDVFVGDRRFAEGEVVVLGEHFGVRVTRIISRGGAVETPDAA